MVHGDGGSRRRMSCIILQTQSEAGLFTVCSLSRPESRSAKQDLRKVRGESGRVPEVMIEYIARKYNHPMCSQCSCICACCPSIPASLCHVTTWISDSDSNTPSMMQTPSDRCGWWLQIACIMYRRDKMAAAWTTHPSSIVQHTACPLDQTLHTTCMKSCPIWFCLWYKELLLCHLLVILHLHKRILVLVINSRCRFWPYYSTFLNLHQAQDSEFRYWIPLSLHQTLGFRYANHPFKLFFELVEQISD